MTKEEFYKDVMTGIEKLPAEWRKGQKVFNYIDANYHVARTLQFEKGVDCFHRDDKIEEFINCAYDLLEDKQ